jgi:hypothetical protein
VHRGSAVSGAGRGGANSIPPARRTPQELKHWRAQIAAAFEETRRVAFPRRELHVTYSPFQGGDTPAVLVRADGARDDYTVRLPDGSLKDCTSSRIAHLRGMVQALPSVGGIGGGATGGAPPGGRLGWPGAAPRPAPAAQPQAQLRPQGAALLRQGSGLARIQQLMAMGFTENQADDALHITGEEIDAAIEVCLRKSYLRRIAWLAWWSALVMTCVLVLCTARDFLC